MSCQLISELRRDEQALVQMQQLHREHCQSFMRRIRYLKVRVTRESAFRSDLAYQKRHLLGTIACFEKTSVPFESFLSSAR